MGPCHWRGRRVRFDLDGLGDVLPHECQRGRAGGLRLAHEAEPRRASLRLVAARGLRVAAGVAVRQALLWTVDGGGGHRVRRAQPPMQRPLPRLWELTVGRRVQAVGMVMHWRHTCKRGQRRRHAQRGGEAADARGDEVAEAAVHPELDSPQHGLRGRCRRRARPGVRPRLVPPVGRRDVRPDDRGQKLGGLRIRQAALARARLRQGLPRACAWLLLQPERFLPRAN
mmetsp:Transcript_65259/g.189163  ORF Transcript_65259/g.189163 Transcript_65259/m.189163 type:complete len:227 (-) Transcript_65259:167-847(-)